MPLIRTPKPLPIDAFLAKQAASDFTYDAVGATDGTPPRGYAVDHTRVQLGVGRDVFIAARLGLENWQQFPTGWIEVFPRNAEIQVGKVVAIVARSLGLWWLNTCRIIDVIDERHEKCRFGFAYGTLPSHMGRGEERFSVEMDADDRVWYEIYAFSRPNGLLAQLGYWHMRHVQRLFHQQSAARMQTIANEAGGSSSVAAHDEPVLSAY